MDSATVTIRVDGIALEQDETFQLRLVANSPPQGIFCLDTLDFVIEDGNGINYYLIIICAKMHYQYYTWSTMYNIIFVEELLWHSNTDKIGKLKYMVKLGSDIWSNSNM